jgi:hypothetical protein
MFRKWLVAAKASNIRLVHDLVKENRVRSGRSAAHFELSRLLTQFMSMLAKNNQGEVEK